ncbi:hypothetical protein [Algibacter sp. PT7-4]|uniref:hypothetical protein n=1 Tax=Algibacter ulvanivorans TaxID=3400999 RepID=UPI003AB0B81B
MNSQKIKSKQFFTHQGKSIAAIVVLPENNQLRLYVAWENEPAAESGFMGFFKSTKLVDDITPELIAETMGYGKDIGHLPEAKKIFKALF